MTFTDDDIYQAFETPYVEPLTRMDGRPTDIHAPRGVTPFIDPDRFEQAGIMQEDIVVADFGSSFQAGSTPGAYTVNSDILFQAPEVLLNAEITQAIDIWSLGCLIFQLRAGWRLFECWSDTDDALEVMVKMLGPLPEPWWSSWTNRSQFFDETGVSHSPPQWTSIRSALEDVGTWEDQRPARSALSLFDQPGARVPEEELVMLDDLLCKMLRYRPEDRITIDEVIRHPWFAFK
jgi:serine/threonine-protein kinase SRPK3